MVKGITKQMLVAVLGLIMGFGGVMGGSAAAMAGANVAKAEEGC